jgi:hypothetical protein
MASEKPKRVRLEEWLAATYGASAPSIFTARRWCRNGNIWPQPEKHGRAYYVSPDARYIDPANPPADLKASGRSSPLAA